MDNPSRWNITNSAQNIVSALVDPSKQYDNAFRREWSNTFSSFAQHRSLAKAPKDKELAKRLSDYVNKLNARRHIKRFEAQQEAAAAATTSDTCSGADEPSANRATCVPEVFMREQFDLSNVECFNQVVFALATDYCQQPTAATLSTTTTTSSRAPLTKAHLKSLQQQFTDYSDVIEERLASQISNRSGDFFQVMSSVDSVMDELTLAIKSVTNLRRRCSSLNSDLILPNMKNIQLSNTRNNAKSVLEKLKEISYLCKLQPMIQLLLSSSDLVGALDLMAKSKVMLRTDLTRVVCLKQLKNQLVEIEVQAEKFINKFHEERKRRIEANLQVEQWRIVEEVPRDFQRLISLLVDESKTISEAIQITTDFQQQQQQAAQSAALSRQHSRSSSDQATFALSDCSSPLSNGSSDRPSMRAGGGGGSSNRLEELATDQHLKEPAPADGQVRARGSSFVIVNSVISFIQIVLDYCKCAQDIRSLSGELLERLFQILQLFNTKTCQLVYKGGAIKNAGLKTITTRNLLVSQRSLKLIILLLPVLHDHFAALLPDYARLKRFNEIRLAYEEHAALIRDQALAIARDVIELQLREWNAKPPVPSAQFNAISQHLIRLHDNILDTLPHKELRALFLEITDLFRQLLKRRMRQLNIRNEAGPQQWQVAQDLTFYRISLSKLSTFERNELNFNDLWDELSEAPQQQQQQQPQQAALAAAGAPPGPGGPNNTNHNRHQQELSHEH